MPDTPQIGNPLWWLHRLHRRLAVTIPEFQTYRDYFHGRHPLPFVPRELEDDFREMLGRSRSNFMRPAVTSKVERMHLRGIHAADVDQPAGWWRRRRDAREVDLWAMWQQNHMDSELELALTDMMVCGRSYLSIWVDQGVPQIHVEDPCEVITEGTPGNRRQVAAAVKVWLDDWTGNTRARVFLPDGVWSYRSKTATQKSTVERPSTLLPNVVVTTGMAWEQDGPMQRNPFGRVPFFPLINRPTTQRVGESELSDVTWVQDRVNENLFNRQLAINLAAYRQKWATGIAIPTDPDTGEPVEPFQAAIDRLWTTTNPDARFGTFEATDVKPINESIDQDVQHIAIQTATPRHYLIQMGQSPSGDAMKSAEAALVARIRPKQRTVGEQVEDATRTLAPQVGVGDVSPMVQVEWEDPEFRVESERVDAAVKLRQGLDMPMRWVLRTLPGYTPDDIEEIVALAEQERLVVNLADSVELEPAPEVPVEG